MCTELDKDKAVGSKSYAQYVMITLDVFSCLASIVVAVRVTRVAPVRPSYSLFFIKQCPGWISVAPRLSEVERQNGFPVKLMISTNVQV